MFSFIRKAPTVPQPDNTEFVKVIVFNSSTPSFKTWEVADIIGLDQDEDERPVARFAVQPKLMEGEKDATTPKPEVSLQSNSSKQDFEMIEQFSMRRWWVKKLVLNRGGNQ